MNLGEKTNSDKKFKIIPEFYDLWGVTEEDDIVNMKEIKRLAYEWNVTIDDLMKQVEEV